MANINRVDQIASEVSKAFHSLLAKDQDRKDARDIFQSSAQAATGARESLLISISKAADEQDMSDSELTMAIDKAKAARNANDKGSINATNTFASEIKRACHPSVRNHVGELFALAAEAWALDDPKSEAKGDGVLRKAFARKYHMVVGAMFEAASGGNRPTEAQTLSDMALDVIRDRERDYTKIHERLKAIADQLRKFYKDFPVDGINSCVEFLDTIKKEELKACVTQAPAARVVDVPELAPVSNEVEPAEGVADIFQDAIDEENAAAA